MDDATLPDQAQIHPSTLRFRDRGLEAGFRAARAGANLRQLRVSLLIAVPLNIVFAPIDYLVLTQNVVTALIIRVPIATAVFLIVLGLSYSPLFRGRETYLPSIAVFCYTLAYAALNAIAASPTSWRRRSVGTRCDTEPSPKASDAEIESPNIAIRAAWVRPIRSARRCMPPASGSIAVVTSGLRKTALSAATNQRRRRIERFLPSNLPKDLFLPMYRPERLL